LMERRCASDKGRENVFVPAVFEAHRLSNVDEVLRAASVEVNYSCHEIQPFLREWSCSAL
jgi:hypothetical protein